MRDLNGSRQFAFLPCAVVMAVLLVSSPLYAQDEDVVIMKVFLNREDKGDYFFLLLNEETAYFKAEDLMDMGLLGIFKNGGDEIKGDTYISLNSLYPRVRFEVDLKASALYMSADPKLLEGNVFDLGYKTHYNVVRTKDSSIFLNYSVSYGLDENLGYTSLGVPWEVVSNINGTLIYSNFLYTKNEVEDENVRLNSNFTVDDPGNYSRIVLGDFSAFSGELGSGGSYGGLSISSNYSTEPFFITSPGVGLTLIISTPSQVEIFVNDLLVDQRSLPSGEFTFSNLPHATGSGKIRIVVKDSYGRTKVYERPFYTSSTLLKPGVHEYSYNYGLKREEFGQESFQYGDPAFLASHRFGLSRYLTMGFRMETDKDVVNAGTTADFILGKVGVFKLSAAGSYGEKETGYAGSVGYNYSTRGFNFRLSGQGFTREYSTLSLTPFEDKPRFVTNTGVGFNLGRFGSLSASYSLTENYTETNTKRTALFYSKRLTRGLSLHASASRTETRSVCCPLGERHGRWHR